MGMNPEGLAAAVRLGAIVKATPRFEGDLRAVPPDKLLFGTDLPGTRARRRFASADLERRGDRARRPGGQRARVVSTPGMSYDIHLDDKYGQLNLVDIPARSPPTSRGSIRR